MLSAPADLKKSALILGCGYLGIRVARSLLADGTRVFAVTRSQERASQLANEGIEPIVADVTKRQTLRNLPAAELALFAVGWDRKSGQSQFDVYGGGLASALAVLSESTNLAYISSTGVYHHCDGSWVDESSPCRPKAGSGGWAHLKAEELLRRERPRGPWTVLRMAGLYGPARVPRAAEIRSGKPITAPTAGYLNLIHIDDAAHIVRRAWEIEGSARTYVVADGCPVVRETYYREIASILGCPSPVFSEGGVSARRRAVTNKRIWTARMMHQLKPRIEYPSYRIGLRAILSSEA